MRIVRYEGVHAIGSIPGTIIGDVRRCYLAAANLPPCSSFSLAVRLEHEATTSLPRLQQTAARILTALSNDPAQPDAVAQFFLAVQYRAGLGVKLDDLRACGLFMKAAAREQPFSGQSAALAESMRAHFGAGAAFCVGDEGLQGGPPQARRAKPSTASCPGPRRAPN